LYQASSDDVKRWTAFQNLCVMLAPVATGPLSDPGGWDWEAFVALASAHFVSPALAAPVERLAFAPDEVKSYFNTLRAMNAQRNVVILRALAEALAALRVIGIEGILLKGAASLVSGLYDDPAERILGDVDLLVQPGKIDNAAKLLQTMGYALPPLPPVERRWVVRSPERSPLRIPHHIPILIHSETGVGIELHSSLAASEFRSMLPPADVFERAVAIEWNGQDVLVLSPTDRVVHNIVHELLHHAGATRGVVAIRQLRELARIVARHGHAVDWENVERRFLKGGHADVLRERAAICPALMGVHMPVEQADSAKEVNRLRANMLRSPLDAVRWSVWTKLSALSEVYFKSFARDPLLAINFLNPRWWPNRLRGIWRFLNDNKLL
jgi:Uncharacterised nucleotidyltransferase